VRVGYGDTHAVAPSLPAIGSERAEIRSDVSWGRVAPVPAARAAIGMIWTLSGEFPFALRWLHLGARYSAGAGETMAAGGPGTALLSGNAGISFRASWVSGHGISFSAGALLYAPLARYGERPIVRDVNLTLRSLRLDDRGAFAARSFLLSPQIDLRVELAVVTVQVRQTLDFSFEQTTTAARSVTATTVVFGALKLGEDWRPGIEITQLYNIDSRAPDDSRSRIMLMPHITYGGTFAPYAGVMFGAPVVHPLGASLWGLRFGMRTEF
jgi:hypothetical protein